jgi:hypothetical protein
MSDLTALFNEAAGPAATPGHAIAEADLARGQRALRRRRTFKLGSRAIGVAAVGLVGFAVVAPTLTSTTPTAPAQAAAPAQTTPATSLALVAYTGKQPAGFILDQVPEGYELQTSDPAVLLLAPAGDTSDPKVFIGKIAITVGADVPEEISRLKVGESTIFANLGASGKTDGTRTLYVKRGERKYLEVQVWAGLKLTDQQILKFADGITVTKNVAVSLG